MEKRFRFDINALRAVAVLGVLFFHLKIPLFGGGFCGVDIFYVISGYLMTRIIVGQLDTDDFSILNFYAQRVKRIVPALLLLVTVVLGAAFFLYLPGELKANARNAASSLLFYSNILYWKNSLGYFNQSSETNLFLHTWSLSVEWQFYMIYPLLILALYRLFKIKKHFNIAFAVITITLAVLSILFTQRSPSASFFLFPSRSWEMMTGGLVWLLGRKPLPVINKPAPARKGLVAAGYIVLIILTLLLSTYMRWPGIFTLPPVLITALIIRCDISGLGFIRNRAIQFIGTISYSLYLWHWPLIVLSTYLGIAPGVLPAIVILALSIGMAWLSYRYIESFPLRSLVPVFSSLILVTGMSVLPCLYDVNKIMFKKETIEISKYQENHKEEIDRQMAYGSCFCVLEEDQVKDWRSSFTPGCLTFDSTKKNYLLIGDSHAASLSASLKESLGVWNIHLLQCTQAGSLPVLGQFENNSLFDYIFNEFIVANRTKIDGIILNGYWAHPINNDYKLLMRNMQKTLSYVTSLGIPALIVGSNETYITPFPSIAAKDFQFKRNSSSLYLNRTTLEVNQLIGQRFRDHFYDIAGVCTRHIGPDNTPYMFDMDHFSKYGADIAVGTFLTDPGVNLFFQHSIYETDNRSLSGIDFSSIPFGAGTADHEKHP